MNSLSGVLYLGYAPGGSGNYALVGGTLDVGSRIRIGADSGAGRFEYTGGSISTPIMVFGINGTLAMGMDFNVVNDLVAGSALFPDIGVITGRPNATLEVTNGATATHDSGTAAFGALVVGSPAGTGIYNLAGGVLNAPTTVNSGGIFNFSGGEVHGGMTSSGIVNLGGSGIRAIEGDVTNNGIMQVTSDTAQFTGDVDNYGQFKTTDTTVTFTGTYTEYGTYISDPSDNYFTSLVVEATGDLQGGVGDNWYVSNDFISHSTQNTTWNTDAASLEFQSGTADNSHDLYWTGDDLGAVLAGYEDNFAWGNLAREAGNILNLFDGDADAGGALYAGILLGLDIEDLLVNNI
ncbi:MAG: hypothetical protein JRJ85_11510, partial [Deltaproteobacteria bacterium]|nr:hypothetical protein [Deltaproteobacteria bacterium]